ncbi:MAG: hypothetical protein IT290_01680 [Deltaproteobacteria bacterium]|nr:hypothetical protein [Deltaproteobacteria bacterium]
MDLTQSGSAVTGAQYYNSGAAAFALVSGTTDGSTATLELDYLSSAFSATAVGTYSGDSMTGSWLSNESQSGVFTCTRVSPGEGNSSRRDSGITLFCNRTGQALSVADCSISVGDKGPLPRVTPSGPVEFATRNGFLPTAASCTLMQTPLSPGVSSCKVQFQIPLGFPIAAQFPIEAIYNGDTRFSPAATEHRLIEAGCVGTPDNPCSGAVALSFAAVPTISKSAMAAILSCGGSTTGAVQKRDSTSGSDAKNECRFKVTAKASAAAILAQIEDRTELAPLSRQILRNLSAGAFTESDRYLLDVTAEFADELYRDERAHALFHTRLTEQQREEEYEEIQASAIEAMALGRTRDPEARIRALIDSAESLISNGVAPRMSASRRSKYVLTEVGTGEVSVGANKQKNLNLRVKKGFGVILDAARVAGVPNAEVNVAVSSSRTGKLPTGAKRKVKFTNDVSLFLAGRK